MWAVPVQEESRRLLRRCQYRSATSQGPPSMGRPFPFGEERGGDMPRLFDPEDDLYVDANGCLTERVRLGGQPGGVHYDDIPQRDITPVEGIRCTTALRTVIDIAPEYDREGLRLTVLDCLERRLFTVEEARARLAQPDMAGRIGAALVRQALPT